LKETNVKTPEERRRAVQVFQYFIKEFRDKIDTPELEIKDLAMGIRGYGIFANVRIKSSSSSKNKIIELFFYRLVNFMVLKKMLNLCLLV
jgi:hypothetical protein